LSDRIQKIWVDFARDGSFPAPEYTAETRQVFHLNIARAVEDPPMPATAFLPR
jgi:para-nitrobenzyl esterase